MDVELIYDRDCPNIGAARAELLRAFVSTRVPPRWTEWAKDDPSAPTHVHGWPSPTILVDGRDVLGGHPVEGACCRIDAREGHGVMRGVADSSRIAEALRLAALGHVSVAPNRPRRLLSMLGALPGVVVALLPKIACPACWPLYAGLLGSLGLGFLLREEILLPVTAAFLAVALSALGVGARRRRGYGPLCVGVLSGVVLLVGKFVLEFDSATPIGVSTLIAASIWNALPRRRGSRCDACPPQLAAKGN